jgi:hypothetical protein
VDALIFHEPTLGDFRPRSNILQRPPEECFRAAFGQNSIDRLRRETVAFFRE